MKLKLTVLAALLVLLPVSAHAFLVDTVVGGVQYAATQAYQAFMKIKIVEEIGILKQNYDASVRYYNEFKRLNQGKGLVANVENQLKTGGKVIEYQMQAQVDRDFIHTYRTDTQADKFFYGLNQTIQSNMKYAGDQLADMINNRNTAVNIAQNADGLSPKDAANLSAKAQGLQLQMLNQLHEDNVRMMEIETMRLAVEAKKQENEYALIQSIQNGVAQRTQTPINGAQP